jgi:redox-sensitive bicupin YhaK (pirin superfamily)
MSFPVTAPLAPYVRRAADRGRTQISWLDSRHTFDFGDYSAPDHAGFGVLRVINDDRVAPAGGFATHGHRDMEIITTVLSGELAHQDSLGNGSVIAAGDVQKMSAGTGIRHSEFNHSDWVPVHFLQIWILPHTQGVAPSYGQTHFDVTEKQGRWCLMASSDGRDGSIQINQDLNLYATVLGANDAQAWQLPLGRAVWLHVAQGQVTINSESYAEGDGLGLRTAGEIQLIGQPASAPAEVLLFDMAAFDDRQAFVET